MVDAVCPSQEGCVCANVYVAVEVGSELVRQSVTCEKCRVIGRASSCNFVANEFAACVFRSPSVRHDPKTHGSLGTAAHIASMQCWEVHLSCGTLIEERNPLAIAATTHRRAQKHQALQMLTSIAVTALSSGLSPRHA